MIRDHLNIHLNTIFVSFAMSSIFHIKALVKRRDNYKRFSGAWLWQLLAKGKDSMEIWISQIIFTCTIFLIFSIHQYPHLKIFLLEMAHYHQMHHQKIHQFSSKMRRGEHQQLLIAQRWKTTETLSKTPFSLVLEIRPLTKANDGCEVVVKSERCWMGEDCKKTYFLLIILTLVQSDFLRLMI